MFPLRTINCCFCLEKCVILLHFNLGRLDKLFEDNKSLFLGVSGLLIMIVLILIFHCCRRCCKKDKKTSNKTSSTNHALSMSHEGSHLPQWRKSAVQPRQNYQKEIVSINV